MSFFQAVNFAGQKKPSGGRITVKLEKPTSTSKKINIDEDAGSEVTYRLGFVPSDSKRGAVEIHSLTNEFTGFDPSDPPKLTSITSSHWNFHGHQPLKITTDTRKNVKLKTSSAEYDKFISNELIYNVLIIEGEQMVLEEVLPGNLKSLKPELPINQPSARSVHTGTGMPSSLMRTATRPTQKTASAADLHEKKMVELEEAAGFDPDAADSDTDNHTKEEVDLPEGFQDDDEPVQEDADERME